MGTLGPSVYPDTCILIYLVEQVGQWAHAVRQRLQPANGALPSLVFTELTRLECRLHPIRSGNALQLAAYDQLFSTPGYRFQALDRSVFDQATQLRMQHGLKTPDALHLAAAVQAGCGEFWTNDQRLARAAHGYLQIVTFEGTA